MDNNSHEQNTSPTEAPQQGGLGENEQAEQAHTTHAMLKLLAIVGLVAILATAAWLSIQMIRFTPTAFSSVSNAVSSAAVTLSSVFFPEEGGEGAVAEEESSEEENQEENSSQEEEEDVEEEQASEVAETSDSGTTVTPTQPSTVTPVSPAQSGGSSSGTVYVPNRGATINPNGSPDLSVTILSTGIALEVDNEDQYFVLSPIPTNRRAAVRFEVENKGDNVSDRWNFTATLPIEGDTDFEYDSPRQNRMNPGDKIQFTLKFDDIAERDKGIIKIELDAGDDDKSTSNNSDLVVVEIEE